jgi:uncharacterized SAM-binding protein YcdF (DUF218 family)
VLVQFLKTLLVPPFSLLLLYFAGVLLRRRRPRLGAWARHGAVALLYLMSTGAGAWLLVHPLEALEPALGDVTAAPAQAIVVLGAGRVKQSPEYDGAAVPDYVALERLSYAARLTRRTGLPLLVTGGLISDDADEAPVALGMQAVLQDNFGTPVRWVETASRTTAENAPLSAPVLRRDGVAPVILVTDAIHMRRARRAFERAGIAVIPAPTFYQATGSFDPRRLMPNAESLRRSCYGVYEWLGLAWYALASPR